MRKLRTPRNFVPSVGHRTVICKTESAPQKERLIRIPTWIEKDPRPTTVFVKMLKEENPRPTTVVVQVLKEKDPRPTTAVVTILKEKSKPVTCLIRQHRRHN